MLELLVSLLTLCALLIVTVDRISIPTSTLKPHSFLTFTKYAVTESPSRIQRRIALVVARELSSSGIISSAAKMIGIPAFQVFSNARIRGALVVAFLVVQVGYALLSNSLWLKVSTPSLLLSALLFLYSYPAVYAWLRRDAVLLAAQDGPFMLAERRRFIALPPEKITAPLRLMSRFHPRLQRFGDEIGVEPLRNDLPLAPFALAILFLIPVPLALIEGFLFSPWPVQAASALVGVSVMITPAILTVLSPILLLRRRAVLGTAGQGTWTVPAFLRSAGPSAVVATGAALAFALLTGVFHGQGGGWFLAVNLAVDTMTAIVTGMFLREVIRRRGDLIATALVLGWVFLLAAVVSAGKLYAAMLLADHPVSLMESCRIAWGLGLFEPSQPQYQSLFWVAQTGCFFWLVYFAALLGMFILSAMARILEAALGLDLAAATPLEILAALVTTFAGLVTIGAIAWRLLE